MKPCSTRRRPAGRDRFAREGAAAVAGTGATCGCRARWRRAGRRRRRPIGGDLDRSAPSASWMRSGRAMRSMPTQSSGRASAAASKATSGSGAGGAGGGASGAHSSQRSARIAMTRAQRGCASAAVRRLAERLVSAGRPPGGQQRALAAQRAGPASPRAGVRGPARRAGARAADAAVRRAATASSKCAPTGAQATPGSAALARPAPAICSGAAASSPASARSREQARRRRCAPAARIATAEQGRCDRRHAFARTARARRRHRRGRRAFAARAQRRQRPPPARSTAPGSRCSTMPSGWRRTPFAQPCSSSAHQRELGFAGARIAAAPGRVASVRRAARTSAIARSRCSGAHEEFARTATRASARATCRRSVVSTRRRRVTRTRHGQRSGAQQSRGSVDHHVALPGDRIVFVAGDSPTTRRPIACPAARAATDVALVVADVDAHRPARRPCASAACSSGSGSACVRGSVSPPISTAQRVSQPSIGIRSRARYSGLLVTMPQRAAGGFERRAASRRRRRTAAPWRPSSRS